MNGKRYRWDCIVSRVPFDIPTIGAEVGVWRGKNAAHLLCILQKLTLHMVDRWQAPNFKDTYFNSGSSIAAMGQSEFDEAKAEALQKVAQFGNRAVVWQEESETAARHFPNGYFDFVFIDGDHSYEGCKRDISIWLPKVKPGGVLGGHDYAHPDQGGVEKAVLESFDRVEIDENRTWFIRVKRGKDDENAET